MAESIDLDTIPPDGGRPARQGLARRSLARRVARGLGLLLVVTWTWLVLRYSPAVPAGWGATVANLWVVGLALWLHLARPAKLPATLGILVVPLLASVGHLLVRPKSSAGEWRLDVARQPTVSFEDERVALTGVRDFEYADGEVRQERWLEKTLLLDDLRQVDFLISYWDEARAVAHTMTSFVFEGGEVLCVSVEARREVGESWNVLPGMFRQFELYYVLGTERDLVGQRVGDRGERVFRFTTRLTPEEGRAFLSNVLRAAEELRSEPAFYHTLSRNCTTTLVHHLNAVWPERTPYERRLWLNGYTPAHAWEAGLIASEGSFEDYVERSEVTDGARAALSLEPDEFSRRLR